jgi:hypothetical protein
MSVSKGVDYYTYASGPQFSIAVTGPSVGSTCGPACNFQHQNLQIDSANIPGWFSYTGTLQWQVTRGGVTIGMGSEQISSLTGNLEGGSMSVMMSTPSFVGPGWALSYGLYDAGTGVAGLTSQDQLYVYATDNYSTWMGDFVAQYPQAGDRPFHQFALPGAHDAGTFSLAAMLGLLSSPYAGELLSLLGPIGIALAVAPRAITNLAVTQKDNVTTMLDLGIRYFDFRPGTLAPPISAFSPGVRYHQHTVIPGYPYISFLQDVLGWLHDHPTEIVVVSANTQGFYSPSMNPSPQDLEADLAAAFAATGLTGTIATGDKSSLGQTVSQLLQGNTRLIFLNQISTPPETIKYDSYSDAYNTLDPDKIRDALAGMTAAGQAAADSDYTVLQMQGTATGVGGDIITDSILTLSDAHSPLLSTKASFDIVTNPWLRENVAKNLPNTQLVVFLNDFVDNCMVSTAITVTRQRMGLA